jgi:hypothetical protein
MQCDSLYCNVMRCNTMCMCLICMIWRHTYITMHYAYVKMCDTLCVHIYIHVYTHTHIYIYIYIYMHIRINVCMYIYIIHNIHTHIIYIDIVACPQHTTRSLFVTGIPPALRRTSLPPTALLVRWRRGSEVRRLLREIARDLTMHGGEMLI